MVYSSFNNYQSKLMDLFRLCGFSQHISDVSVMILIFGEEINYVKFFLINS